MRANCQADFDVIVMGAGPAGAAAARTAREAGLSVALVDKARFPRDKLCGGCFTGRSYQMFSRIYGERIPDHLIETRHAITFRAHGQDLGTINDTPPFHLTMRRELDAEMCTRALASGAIDLTGQRVSEIDLTGPTITLADGRRISGQILIGADGVNSQVAKQIFGTSFNRNRTAFGLEVEAPPSENNAKAPLRIDFAAAQWGYGWDFPKTGSSTIGICGLVPANPDFKGAMRDYLNELGQEPSMACKGQFLPFGDFRKVPGRGTVLLAGDAAGLVDPITGEGIALAMESGHLAALAAAKALKANRSVTALEHYKTSLRPIHKSLLQARMLRQIIYRPVLHKAFIGAFRNSRSIRSLYMHLLAGEVTYGEMMAATVRRLPSFAWRSVWPGGQSKAPKG